MCIRDSSLADAYIEEVEVDLLLNHQVASFMGTLTYWLTHPHYKSQQMSDFHTKAVSYTHLDVYKRQG